MLLSVVMAAEPEKFRTDDNPDKSLPWYQIVPGEFPPANSAHAISGELILTNPTERLFQIRVDRDDSQDAGHLDLPLEAVMLPYGAVYYHGAPASLRDIPLGTHLYGQFYMRDPEDKTPPPDGQNNRKTQEIDFRRCFRLEDNFTYFARQNQTWQVEQVNLPEMKVTVSKQQDGKASGETLTYDLLSSTQVFTGSGFGKLQDLQAGQTVQLNVTWATLYGPGRVLEIWLDQASRDLATQHQLERHRNFIRQRGLAGWVDAVNDKDKVVTLTFFDGVEPALFDELTLINEEPHGWPFSGQEKDPKAPKGGICVARECLMTYDPVNDRKGGNILAIRKVPVQPGCSGIQIDVQCVMLLEGFRPGNYVRFYPATWKVLALPREEQFYARE